MNAVIIGPLQFGGNSTEDKHQEFAETLKQHGIEPLVPHDLFDVPDIKTLKENDYIKRITEHVCKCDVVITLDGWHMERIAKRVVDLATQLEVEVIPQVNFAKWIKRKQEQSIARA
jgi:hydroxypyruvate isomerase